MMKATLKGKYEALRTDKGYASATPSATVSVTANVDDVNVKATVTDVTAAAVPFPSGLSIAVEKPGAFAVDYSPKKDVTFRFQSAVRVLGQAVDLSYEHARGAKRTTVGGSLAFDAANRMSASYGLETGQGRVGYVWTSGAGLVVEPTYDVGKNAWDLAVTRRFQGGDAVRATYQTAAKTLGVAWTRHSKLNGFQGILLSRP